MEGKNSCRPARELTIREAKSHIMEINAVLWSPAIHLLRNSFCSDAQIRYANFEDEKQRTVSPWKATCFADLINKSLWYLYEKRRQEWLASFPEESEDVEKLRNTTLDRYWWEEEILCFLDWHFVLKEDKEKNEKSQIACHMALNPSCSTVSSTTWMKTQPACLANPLMRKWEGHRGSKRPHSTGWNNRAKPARWNQGWDT